MQATAAKNFETEVKFFSPDLAYFRNKLVEAGAMLAKERVFERNVRFDTVDNVLLKRRELLRLRQDTVIKITYKGMPINIELSEAKVREELEIQVDDSDMAALIFNRLGFFAKQVYEKYRETFYLEDVEIVLDELPFGNFVELEGEETSIKKAAVLLGLDWRKRIITNYLDLMNQLKLHHHLPFDDLTFNNFDGLSISIADILT